MLPLHISMDTWFQPDYFNTYLSSNCSWVCAKSSAIQALVVLYSLWNLDFFWGLYPDITHRWHIDVQRWIQSGLTCIVSSCPFYQELDGIGGCGSSAHVIGNRTHIIVEIKVNREENKNAIIKPLCIVSCWYILCSYVTGSRKRAYLAQGINFYFIVLPERAFFVLLNAFWSMKTDHPNSSYNN